MACNGEDKRRPSISSANTKGSQASKVSTITLSSTLSALVRKPGLTFATRGLERQRTTASLAAQVDVQKGDWIETISGVTMRTSESIESEVVGELAIGTQLRVVEKGEGRRIKVVNAITSKSSSNDSSCEGWISTKTKLNEPLIAKTRLDTFSTDFEVGGTHEVQSNVTVRSGESLDSQCVMELSPGTLIKIVGVGVQNTRRVRITCDFCDGWISTSTKSGELLIGKKDDGSKRKPLLIGSNRIKDLLESARSGDFAKVKSIVEGNSGLIARFTSKINLNASDIRGKTALTYASAFGHAELVSYFLSQREVDVNVLDDTQKTALHHACKGSRQNQEDKVQAWIATELLRNGAQLEARDHNGCTALMLASANGFLLVSKCLLSFDADVNCKDFEGYSPLDYAREFLHTEVFTYLKKNGGLVGLQDEEVSQRWRPQELDPVVEENAQGPDEANKVAKPKLKAKKKVTKKKIPLEDKTAENPEIETAEVSEAGDAGAAETNTKKKKMRKGGKPKQGGRKMRDAVADASGSNEVVVQEDAKEEEDDKTVAMRKLQTVLQKVDCVEALAAAVREAECAGATEAELEDAKTQLQQLYDKQEARVELQEAIQSLEVDALKEAIEKAKAVGLEPQEMEAAEKTLAIEVPKACAREKLIEAQGAGDTAELKKAIAEAKKVGIEADELKEFEDLVASAESKALAEKELAKAIASLDINSLKGAIKICKEANVDPEKIAEAERVLAEEEPKVEARAKIDEAVELGTDDELLQALDMAKKAKLLPEEYAEVEDLLEKNKKRREALEMVAKQHKESEKCDMKDIDSVREAKEMLKKAIDTALNAGVPEDDLVDSEMLRKKLHNTVEDLKGAIRVFCRVRPINSREKGLNDSEMTRQKDPMTLEIKETKGTVHTFNFDAVFTPGSQEEIFEDCKDLVQSAVDGYNVTLFAYGQTGAGKTFTMAGVPGNLGVSPRTIEEIFKVTKANEARFNYTVMGSMLELYCQDLVDLLAKGNPATSKQKLKIREQKDGTIFVEHLSAEQVNSAGELHVLLDRGMKNRATAATAMNSESSRSHLVLMIQIISVNRETKEQMRGKILIVDLAGSERLSKSMVTGQAQKESIQINQSLTCLGNVIEACTKPKKGVQAPYRDSNLTMVMKDALGGTAKTLMFVNISPAGSNLDESLNSLKYAQRAKHVQNKQEKKHEKDDA